MTIKLITSFVLAFLFASAFGKYYVPWLRRQKAGQQIKSQVDWHKSKAGTPTMGGVMFIFGAILVCLTVGAEGMLHGRFEHIFVLLFACVFGLIGFLDDWEKLKKKENMGLSSRSKFLLQLTAALVFILLMRQIGFVHPHLYVPFSQRVVYMPEWLYLMFAAFVIVGTVNAVNITDGVDGLASGTSLPVFLFFVAVSIAWGRRYQELGIFASAMVGGLCGFLIYNFNPAKCFMGDTGSLFLGGAIAALALPTTCRWYSSLRALSLSLRLFPTSFRWDTSKSPTASVSSKWLPSTTIWKWADGREKSGKKKNSFSSSPEYLLSWQSYPL